MIFEVKIKNLFKKKKKSNNNNSTSTDFSLQSTGTTEFIWSEFIYVPPDERLEGIKKGETYMGEDDIKDE